MGLPSHETSSPASPREVLDLSDTQADEAVLQAVFTQQSLTHLRMCRNPAMDNHLLERVLLRLPNLEAGESECNSKTPQQAEIIFVRTQPACLNVF